VFLQWFDASQFASVWSVLSTSMNIACAIGPVLISLVLTMVHWRACFVLLGTLTSDIGVFQWRACFVLLITLTSDTVCFNGVHALYC